MNHTSHNLSHFFPVTNAASSGLRCRCRINGNDKSVGQSLSTKNRLNSGKFHNISGKILPGEAMPEYQRNAL
jgi:hypothetical protein